MGYHRLRVTCLRLFATLTFLATVAFASPTLGVTETAPTLTRFTSTNNANVSLRFVSDSGVCETTPGVHQMSGYIDVGTNMSMWFWFFESRAAPETAPFTLWSLLAQRRPWVLVDDRTFPRERTVSLLYLFTKILFASWNNISNMIYIDQPIGTGFSFGTDTVNSTQSASPFVWQAFQILFESKAFAKYKSREFIFATESYGGHYGPAFVTFFDQQNALINEGKLKGELLTVSALMINNGWYDPLIQNKAYLDFATNAPGYGQLQPDDVLQQMNTSFFQPGGCKDQELACYAAGTGPESNTICGNADGFCIDNLFVPAVGDRDSDDLRQNSSALFPPEFYVKFLREQSIMTQIGAEHRYSECPDAPFELFTRTGDDARTLLPQLGALANSRLKMLIWAGDADINCNWLGGHASVLAMNWYGAKRLASTPFKNMTINGESVAAIQNMDNFSFARVFQSGHEVPAFQPQAAFEIFKQVIHKEQLHSVIVKL
ncbi:alpha/beta-hydrolase [Gymnopilus junonius]|uniref:Alpha/beta-hydrolase n=1 Tax=Gymnopilus junonius TaxID=109634 RepID=A0A9P5NNH3_GYMJU|nr:alpha/beta-hydrolase [Gymnopilus junonius]